MRLLDLNLVFETPISDFFALKFEPTSSNITFLQGSFLVVQPSERFHVFQSISSFPTAAPILPLVKLQHDGNVTSSNSVEAAEWTNS